MLSAIAFAIKILMAAAFVVAFSLGKGTAMPRDRVGFYALISVVTAAVTAVSQELNSGLLAGAVFVVIGFISYSQFQNEGDLFETLQAISEGRMKSIRQQTEYDQLALDLQTRLDDKEFKAEEISDSLNEFKRCVF